MFKPGLMAIAVAVWAGGAGATSPCPPGAQCAPLPPEFFVAMSAQIAAMPLACAKHDPANAERYAAAAQAAIAALPQADREMLATARQDPGYPAMLDLALEQIERDNPSQRLKRRCDAVLNAAPIDAAPPPSH